LNWLAHVDLRWVRLFWVTLGWIRLKHLISFVKFRSKLCRKCPHPPPPISIVCYKDCRCLYLAVLVALPWLTTQTQNSLHTPCNSCSHSSTVHTANPVACSAWVFPAKSFVHITSMQIYIAAKRSSELRFDSFYEKENSRRDVLKYKWGISVIYFLLNWAIYSTRPITYIYITYTYS
jgi:hypothetical protein